MPRLWAKIIKNQRIVRQMTEPCTLNTVDEALETLCKGFDIPKPIWLNKHEHEFADFGRTSFTAEHFMEEIAFQKLEIEYLADDGKKHRSNDPRNQFDGI